MGRKKDVVQQATDWINARLAEIPGLSLNVVEYRDGVANFKGTLPKSIEQVPGQEYTVLGQDLRAP